MAGIYIHIPFCKQACHYCDFHFSTNLTLRKEIFHSLKKELILQKGYLSKPVETIYFGGGTPSLLTNVEIQSLLDTISTHYSVTASPEITLEANPDDLTEQKLKDLYKVGINRLSIGVQSFDDEVLKFLNRAHSKKDAQKCISLAQNVGFSDLTIDLIYGIPSRSHQLWIEDIATLLNYLPNHISAYCLTIEPGTAFGNWFKKGKFTPVSEDFAAEQFEILTELLEKSGYEQYEISNFCLDSKYSKHNTAYWQDKPYLGIGPSAHSYNHTSRQFNIKNNAKYVRALATDHIPYEFEKLSKVDRLNDYLLTGIRTKWGIDLSKFQPYHALNQPYLDLLVNSRKADIKENHLILTKEGRLLADKITEELLIDANQNSL